MAVEADDIGPDGKSPGTPTARRMVLGAQLRRLRESRGISRADAGYAIRGSESKMSRIELGRVSFKERDITDLLTLYGVRNATERDAFLEMVEHSNRPGWWHRYSDVIPSWFNDFVGLEESASRIQTFQHQFVPGLLQTEDYARAVVSQGKPAVDDEDVDRRVTLRLQRQKILARPDAPRFWAVVDESVLHRQIGGRDVFKAQIEMLLELTSMRHITLQILPYAHSGLAAEGAFTVLRFADEDLPTIVYIEHLRGALYLDRPDEIEAYSRVLDVLSVDAETPVDSRELLKKVLADL